MDANLKKLLDELPGKPPRSRLEPYREFIEELRGRGRTYLRTRLRAKTKQAESGPPNSNRLPVVNQVAAGTIVMASSSGEVQRKIAALKARKKASEPDPRGFDYDPDKPLRLKRSGRE